MTGQAYPIWQPRKRDLEDSFVAKFMRHLGFDSYDDFYQFSVDQPDRYWRAFNDYYGFVWSKKYEQFSDFSKGSEFPQWFIGGELNWVDNVLRWADHPVAGKAPAIIAEREAGSIEQIDYRELRERVRRLAGGLKAYGIKRGDRIGLLMENGIEANVSFLAISYIGAIVVPLFTGFGVDAIVSRLSSCQARILLATTGFARRGKFVDAASFVQTALKQLPTVETVFWKASPEGPALVAGQHNWYDLAAHEPIPTPPERMKPSDPFMVIYTSGTTGKPKGPVHTHGGFPLKMAHDSAIHINIQQGDILCWPADMGWIAGPLVSTSALLNGATLVTYDGAPDFPNWSRMANIIERNRVTHYGASPTLIRGFQAHAKEAVHGDLSTIQVMVTAGESISPEHHHWFHQNFGRMECPIINITGGTEVSCALLASVVVKPIAPSCFNTQSPGVSVDVVNADGQPLRDQIGELAILAPFVGMCSSFWEDDERYLDSYWRTIPGLWVHGDLALLDKDGFFYLLGRSDDTIKVAGKRLGPAEVEVIVVELEAVSEAAAIGVDDPLKGNKLLVFVILKPDCKDDHTLLKKQIKERVEQRMGKPFRPSEVYIVEQMPKTRSTKVMRRLIRNVYSGAPLGDLSALDNHSALDEIKRVIQPDVAG